MKDNHVRIKEEIEKKSESDYQTVMKIWGIRKMRRERGRGK